MAKRMMSSVQLKLDVGLRVAQPNLRSRSSAVLLTLRSERLL
jgi:hypothetical protein